VRLIWRLDHKVQEGGGAAWAPTSQSHSRRFMVGHHPVLGAVSFWGEWEADAKLVREYESPGAGMPHRLWAPYLAPRGDYANVHNTDPFVFGSRFLYTECLQGTHPLTQRIQRGDIILFGGPTSQGWVLDTVLHVSHRVSYTMAQFRERGGGLVPPEYYPLVIWPLAANEPPGKERTLYTGRGQSSWVPAAWPPRPFARPIVDMPYDGELFQPVVGGEKVLRGILRQVEELSLFPCTRLSMPLRAPQSL
jgi:hypothetical protein